MKSILKPFSTAAVQRLYSRYSLFRKESPDEYTYLHSKLSIAVDDYAWKASIALLAYTK